MDSSDMSAQADAQAEPTGARYASRKFVLTMLVIAEAGAFLAAGAIDPATWAAITGAALAAYITGNVAQVATTK